MLAQHLNINSLFSNKQALNGTGAAYVANRSLPVHLQETGHSLFKAALILQLVVITSFVALATTFDRRCRKHGINHTKVNQPLLTLYISTALILVRTIYRTVEYFEIESVNLLSAGFDLNEQSPIIRDEWLFYVFEAALMLINSLLINVRHPRRWLPQSTKVYLAKGRYFKMLRISADSQIPTCFLPGRAPICQRVFGSRYRLLYKRAILPILITFAHTPLA